MKSAKPPLARNNFDFIRFVLASLVVLSHSYPLATGTEDAEPLALLTNRQLTLGSFAVDAFFVLSGYLIAQSWQSAPAVRVFLTKRVRRIYPGFLVAAVLGAFVIGPVFSNSGYSSINGDFIASFIGRALRLIASEPAPSFPNNPAPGAVNGSLWSISYEFWCYLLVLLCGVKGWLRKTGWLWAAVAAAIVTSLTFEITKIHPGGSYLGLVLGYPPFWARLLPYFLVGMAFHASGKSIALNVKGAAVCALALVIAARLPYGMTVVLPVAAAYLLFWVAQLPLRMTGRFSTHGDLSYGIYLYSFPILQMVMAVYGRPWAPLPLFVVAWLLSIIAAALSWHLVERRFVRSRPPPLQQGGDPAPGKVRA